VTTTPYPFTLKRSAIFTAAISVVYKFAGIMSIWIQVHNVFLWHAHFFESSLRIYFGYATGMTPERIDSRMPLPSL
jgi:hypothetical protein